MASEVGGRPRLNCAWRQRLADCARSWNTIQARWSAHVQRKRRQATEVSRCAPCLASRRWQLRSARRYFGRPGPCTTGKAGCTCSRSSVRRQQSLRICGGPTHLCLNVASAGDRWLSDTLTSGSFNRLPRWPFISLLILPSLDRRFGWSNVPTPITLAADIVVVVGFWIVFLVFRVNTFTAATVGVATGQTVISQGPYASSVTRSTPAHC